MFPRVGRRLCALLVVAGAVSLGRGRPCGAEGEEPAKPEAPTEVPVTVTATVDETDGADLGLWRVKLAFTAEEDVGRPYRVVLHLTHRGVVVRDLDHSPRPPVSAWKKGQKVAYEIPAPLPQEGLPPGASLDVYVGFVDPELDKVIPFRGDGPRSGNLLRVATLPLPAPPSTDEEERIAQVTARADALAQAGRKPDAWRLLETALRRAVRDPPKRRYRDALLRLGSLEADPPSLIEQEILAQRVAEERLRHLRESAGRAWDRGQAFAALRLLEEIGGVLAEQTGQAVIGALADAKRAEKDLLDLQVRVLGQATDEDKTEAQKAIEQHGGTPALLAKARSWAAKKEYAKARILFRSLGVGSDKALAEEANRSKAEMEAAWLGQTPPEQAQVVEAAKNHPAFARLGTVASQKFLFLGPKTQVEGIPPESRLRFDLAFVFLTDLFGRLPNPSGDRVTVYFKELWDFGGGQGGGKIIDIGKADPAAKGTRVDTGLLYHELTHCVDDTKPIHEGFREGLANFGAAFAFESLGQDADTLHAFAGNLEAFRRDYVGRDVAYWRIPSYGPSAGFFLHFSDKYARAPWGHDWAPWRKFFRAYRRVPVMDGREPYLIRSFAHHLVEAFGPGAFDDLIAFRFPLVESDRAAVVAESGAFEAGEHELSRRAEEFGKFPNSPYGRDLLTKRMLAISQSRADDVRALGEQLGILYDWRVIGPFKTPGADPRARVCPPEEEIDFAKEYVDGLNTARWRVPAKDGMVSIDARGWVALNFSYMDETATYAATSFTVDRAQEAFVHARADDDLVVFLNDRRVESFVTRWEASHQVPWRGPVAKVPDQVRFPVTLQEGRNRLLLKVRNRGGQAGFVLAVSRRDGRAIEGLKVDAAAAAGTTVPAPAKTRWQDVFDHAFRGKSFDSWVDVAVGRFKVVNKRLVGDATDKKVGWRKHTVRPGFPADSPSNLLWLESKATDGLADFRLKVTLAPPANEAPKLALTFQGDGGTDGLGGWTLLLHPDGDKRISAQLERYEDLAYELPPTELPTPLLAGEEAPLLLTHVDGRLAVTYGDLVLFKSVSILPIPGRHRIGLATWGPSLGVAAIELERPAPTK